MANRSPFFVQTQPGGMFSIQDQGFTTGSVFFVDSVTGTNSAGAGRNPDTPVATIDYAVGLCTANKGDVIYVMPGHVETVSAAAGLVFDVAGVTVKGLGRGASRPKINFTTAVTADVDIDAASVTFDNLLFTGGFDNVTAALDVNASDFSLINCEFRDVTGQVAIFLAADNSADRLLIDRLVYRGDLANAGTTQAIQLIGADWVTIRNSDLRCNASTAVINVATTAVTELKIHDCYINNANSADVCIKDTVTGSTGTMGPNLFLNLTDNAANVTEAITGATFRVFDNVYVVNADNEKAMLINWTASTDA